MRTRVAGSVRFRLTVTVVLVVGLSLLGGGALLVKWVEATLVNDLRTRNEQILNAMADALQRGEIPLELRSTQVVAGTRGPTTTRCSRRRASTWSLAASTTSRSGAPNPTAA
jgi:hypothetical protein